MARFPLPFVWTVVLALGMAVSPACSQRGKKVLSGDLSQQDIGDGAAHDATLDESHPPDGRHPDALDVHEDVQDVGDVGDLVDMTDSISDVPDSHVDVSDSVDLSDTQLPDVPVDSTDATEDTSPDVTPEPIPFLLEGFSAACGVMQSVDYRVTFRMAPFGLAVTQESKNENYIVRPVSSWIKK